MQVTLSLDTASGTDLAMLRKLSETLGTTTTLSAADEVRAARLGLGAPIEDKPAPKADKVKADKPKAEEKTSAAPAKTEVLPEMAFDAENDEAKDLAAMEPAKKVTVDECRALFSTKKGVKALLDEQGYPNLSSIPDDKLAVMYDLASKLPNK